MMNYYQILGNKVIEGTKEIPVCDVCDVIIAGGGPSGFAAALGAAKAGAKTILIENNSFLGGERLPL